MKLWGPAMIRFRGGGILVCFRKSCKDRQMCDSEVQGIHNRRLLNEEESFCSTIFTRVRACLLEVWLVEAVDALASFHRYVAENFPIVATDCQCAVCPPGIFQRRAFLMSSNRFSSNARMSSDEHINRFRKMRSMFNFQQVNKLGDWMKDRSRVTAQFL